MLRYAIRALRNSPGYTAACIAILALGIGANTAIFSLVYSVVLKPLPYPDADRLVFLWGKDAEAPEHLSERLPVSRDFYDHWRQEATSFSDMAAFLETPLPETGVERPRSIRTEFVSTNLLPLLGAAPSLGRVFRPEEGQPGQDLVAVISDEYFEKRWHRDPKVLGQTLALNGVDYRVIGVLPASFRVPAVWQGSNRHSPEAFLPLSRRWANTKDGGFALLHVAAKLKPGVTARQARVELDGISARLSASDEDRYFFKQTNVFSFTVEDQNLDANETLYLLLGAVGFVLLIACANLANLTLARAALRLREIAVRRALGASRTRIVLHLLSESFLVSVGGGAAGLLVALWILEAVRLLAPGGDVLRPGTGELSVPIFAFAAAASILTTLLVGLLPALAASRTTEAAALKQGGRTASAAGVRSRNLFTIFEVATALVLLVGAGLLIRSFRNAVETGIGFNAQKLAVVRVSLPETRYPDAASRARFLRTLLTRAAAIPGVTSAGFTDSLPLDFTYTMQFYRADQPAPSQDKRPWADVANISPGYLDVIGVPLLAGRRPSGADAARNSAKGKQDGAIFVNQEFANLYFAGEDPLKK